MRVANAQIDRSNTHPLVCRKEFGIKIVSSPLSIPNSHVTLSGVTFRVSGSSVKWDTEPVLASSLSGREGRMKDELCVENTEKTAQHG